MSNKGPLLAPYGFKSNCQAAERLGRGEDDNNKILMDDNFQRTNKVQAAAPPVRAWRDHVVTPAIARVADIISKTEDIGAHTTLCESIKYYAHTLLRERESQTNQTRKTGGFEVPHKRLDLKDDRLGNDWANCRVLRYHARPSNVDPCGGPKSPFHRRA